MMKKFEQAIPGPVPSRERKAQYRRRMEAQGLVQVSGWVPVHAAPDFYVIAAALRQDRELGFGPLRHLETGHFRKF